MINDKIERGAIIAAVVLAVGVGAYFAGAKALGACDSKAKAKSTAMASNGATTCEKIHASATASKNGADAKARNAVMTDADACPYMKSQKAQAARTAAVFAKEGCPPEACEASGSGACPMEKGAKGSPSKKVENKKAAPKGTMASVVPAETTTK